MSGGESGRSFEYTPTWVVALVCFIIVFISVVAERALHALGRCFKRKHQEPLFEALQKVKEELMLLGFISLLLTVFQGLISSICMPRHLSDIMLPCKFPTQKTSAHINGRRRRLLAQEAASGHCSTGYVPFLSLEALHQLHIFIFVLAVVYVVCCAATMVLGTIKIREWRHWEHSIRKETSRRRHHRALVHRSVTHKKKTNITTAAYNLSGKKHSTTKSPTNLQPVHVTRIHLKEFMERSGNYWRKFHVVSWLAAFFKQFYGSVTKSDYTALRSGFIREHCPSNPEYDFYKYMLRTLEHDFKRIIGISWYLWLFVVIFLLINMAGWHAYFWMSFLPLAMLLIVGAKLEHIITELAKEAAERGDAESTTTVRVRPSDELFWFHSPNLVLYLIHFILFQNSFEIAFFLWLWTTYGFTSCIMEGLSFVIPRLVIGVIVQVLCSYSTLPLYALVSQMGSNFKQTVFDEYTRELIRIWAKKPSEGASADRLAIETSNPISLTQQPVVDSEKTTSSEIQLSCTRY